MRTGNDIENEMAQLEDCIIDLGNQIEVLETIQKEKVDKFNRLENELQNLIEE